MKSSQSPLNQTPHAFTRVDSTQAAPANDATPLFTTSESIRRARQRHFNELLKGYIVTDIVGLLLGFMLALNLSWAIHEFFFSMSYVPYSRDFETLRVMSLGTIAAGCLLRFQYLGHYRVRMNFWQELNHITVTLSMAMLVDGFFQFTAKSDLSRMWMLSGWVFAAIGISALRSLYRVALRRAGVWEVPTLLVGGGVTADDTRLALETEKGLGFVITSQITNLPEAFMQAGRSWEKLCRQHNVRYVVIALDGKEMDEAEKPIAQLMRESVSFSISPPRRNLPVLDMVPQYFFNSDVKLLTHNRGLEQPLPSMIKRAFDILVSGTALLLASPLMLVLAAMTKRDGGPVFFGHKRLGGNGKYFYCLKFRSMIVNSQEVLEKHLAANPEARAEWEADQKLKHDPRITKVGQFLRSTSLDELPQLINVLRGEMSLVGPRPIVTDEVAKYEYDIAHYYRVRPGITGLWQVSGRNDVSYAQRVQMDSWYVRNWSLWHDIAIMCKTVPALLQRKGAY
ncbi:MAG: undecaprenyl-phosphate galactose phosphotransferase WbaP [Proteobacteria bacterium]|nr:undecaprenyl-phosphate galactose phosphotransferase WbaP [Pseudomonadota bacterium]